MQRRSGSLIHIALIVALSLIAGCQSEEKPVSQMTPQERARREPTYIVVQQRRISEKLKDPASAKFRNSKVFYAIAPVVCGEVNAKNGFGGYSGYTRFASGGSIQVLESEMAPGEMDKTWDAVCK
jgi:hypothetical protein